MNKSIYVLIFLFTINSSSGQSIVKTMKNLPDTGENVSYTATNGEDNDYMINPPFFLLNGNGIVTDTMTGLMWAQADAGEMTFERALNYCDTLTLGGYTNWRLPLPHEAFSIQNMQHANPSLDLSVYTTTAAEYWWTSVRQINDTTKIWVTNAGGGIGNHPKSETISAGGTKKFHTRAVRDITNPSIILAHFTDNSNGTITDNLTGLIWQKDHSSDSLTWEQALGYADTLSWNGSNDWRLPNIKEIESINDENMVNPSVNATYFPDLTNKKVWSSTTLPNQTTKAWYLQTQFGITTYDSKIRKDYVLCVRGNNLIATKIDSENDNLPSINLFPNPSQNFLTLITNEPLKSVHIFNLLGEQELFEQLTTNNQQLSINVSTLKAGVYFVEVETEKGVVRKKLLKD